MLIPAAAYRRGLNRGDPSPFYSQGQAKASSIQSYLDQSGNLAQYNDMPTSVDPKYDWASKALQAGANANKLVGESSQNAIQNQLAVQKVQLKRSQKALHNGTVISGGSPGGSPGLKQLLNALGQQESGGNFGAVNSGSGALGKWQVMPSNVAGWSQQALGHAISTTQFLHDPKAQKQIVKSIFGNYVKKYGAKGALSAWYSGDPERYKDKSHVSSGPSVYDYVQSVLGKL